MNVVTTPGLPPSPSPQVRRAIRLLMRVTGPIGTARDRKDWVTVADLGTSGDDARIALRAAMAEWPRTS